MEISPKLKKRALIVVVCLAAFYLWANAYSEWLWFRSAGDAADRAYEQVYTKILLTSTVLAVVTGVACFAALYLNLRHARRKPREEEHYIGPSVFQYLDREMVEGYVDSVILWGSSIIAVLCALLAKNRWLQFMQFVHGQPFGDADPVFGLDISFYVFKLPFLHSAFGGALTITLLTLAAVVLMHLYQDRVFVTADGVKLTPVARRHIWALGAVVLVLNAVRYVFNSFELLLAQRGLFGGAGYTDLHGRLWVMYACAAISVGIAGLLLTRMRTAGDARRETIALGVLAAVAIVIGNVYPRALQVYVGGGEKRLERPYIAHNIEATRKAYGLDRITTSHFAANTDLTVDDLERNRSTIDSIRIWDHRPLRDVYTQMEQLFPYYQYVGIDVDRYQVEGRTRQVMLGTRELNLDALPPQSRTWQNRHLVYTHGYGISMSPVDAVGRNGMPEFFISGLPPEAHSDIPLTRPEIYFGEFGYGTAESRRQEAARVQAPGGGYDDRFLRGSSAMHIPPFVVVGGRVDEMDYPNPKAEGAAVKTTYQGKAGVGIGSLWRKLIFATRFRSGYILVSPDLGPDSKLLMHREIRERASTLAPVLGLDIDPYMSIDADGTPFWIIDAYTRTSRYPYSTVGRGRVNYVRNSVKITVDAYDGTVRFYACDDTDPLLKTYQSMFPSLFEPLPNMPEDRQAHLRYPLYLFMIQSEMLIRYHVQDPDKFYSGEMFWKHPEELHGPHRRGAPAQQQPQGPGLAPAPQPASSGQEAIPMLPYYVNMEIPGEDGDDFVLMLPFTRQDRPNLASWLGAYWRDSGPGLRLFEFPEHRVVWGPMQFEAQIDADEYIAQQFTLWGQGGSEVIRGNTLIIPIDGSLLYVEPLYIQAEATALPGLKQVIVAYGEELEMRDTLHEALLAVLGAAPTSVSGSDVEPADTAPKEGAAPQPEPPPSIEAGGGPIAEESLVVPADILDQLEARLKSATDAQGEAQRELDELRKAVRELRARSR